MFLYRVEFLIVFVCNEEPEEPETGVSDDLTPRFRPSVYLTLNKMHMHHAFVHLDHLFVVLFRKLVKNVIHIQMVSMPPSNIALNSRDLGFESGIRIQESYKVFNVWSTKFCLVIFAN